MRLNNIQNNINFGTKIVLMDKYPIDFDFSNNSNYFRMQDFYPEIVFFDNNLPQFFTREVDICTAGILIGNNSKVGAFHIAPTLDNYDDFVVKSKEKSSFNNSLDVFIKNSDGIDHAIVVGGKKKTCDRDELSVFMFNQIKDKLNNNDVAISYLTDFKRKYCDLVYDKLHDILTLFVSQGDKKPFGEVDLNTSDELFKNY